VDKNFTGPKNYAQQNFCKKALRGNANTARWL